MREIKLTKNKITLVDNEDFDRLNQHKWHAYWDGLRWYARRTICLNGKHRTIRMHREIMNATNNTLVDHKDGDGLFNCKANLRMATHAQNMHNRRYPNKNNKMGIKGIRWHKRDKRFQARIRVNGKNIYLGSFVKLNDADITYRQAEVKYFGEFARESSRLYIKILNPEYQLSLAG